MWQLGTFKNNANYDLYLRWNRPSVDELLPAGLRHDCFSELSPPVTELDVRDGLGSRAYLGGEMVGD